MATIARNDAIRYVSFLSLRTSRAKPSHALWLARTIRLGERGDRRIRGTGDSIAASAAAWFDVDPRAREGQPP